jgi:hypothetical protein
MHGIFIRAVDHFLADTHGETLRAESAAEAGLPADGLEAMQRYPAALLDALIGAAARRLALPREGLLEDLGTYLVTHPRHERLRRLLRFGGVDFVDFLHSLEELPGRGRLALADLDLPALRLVENGPGCYDLNCFGFSGIGHLLMGILRAMADDYGALAVLVHEGGDNRGERILISLAAPDFTAGRRFDLTIRNAC